MELYETARSSRNARNFSDSSNRSYHSYSSTSTLYGGQNDRTSYGSTSSYDKFNKLRHSSSSSYLSRYESNRSFQPLHSPYIVPRKIKRILESPVFSPLTYRRQSDQHVSLYDSLIDTDPASTEDEWKKYLERGCLVEKAVEQLRRQVRYPKAVFEYSPKSRSPYSYNITPTTKLVSNPQTPRDKYGKKVRDKGMEELERHVVKEPNDILWYNTQDTPSITSKPPSRSPQQETLTPRGRRKHFLRDNSLSSVLEVEEMKSTRGRRSGEHDSSRSKTVYEEPSSDNYDQQSSKISRMDRLATIETSESNRLSPGYSNRSKTSSDDSSRKSPADDNTPERSRKYSSETDKHRYNNYESSVSSSDRSRRRSKEDNRRHNENDLDEKSSRKHSSDSSSTSKTTRKPLSAAEERRRRYKDDLEELDRKQLDETLEQNRRFIQEQMKRRNLKYKEEEQERQRQIAAAAAASAVTSNEQSLSSSERSTGNVISSDENLTKKSTFVTEMEHREETKEKDRKFSERDDHKSNSSKSLKEELKVAKKEKGSKSPRPWKKSHAEEEKSPKSHQKENNSSIKSSSSSSTTLKKEDNEEEEIKKSTSRTHKLFDSIRHSTIRRNKKSTEKKKNEKGGEETTSTNERNRDSTSSKENVEMSPATSEVSVEKKEDKQQLLVKKREEHHSSSKARPTTMYDNEEYENEDTREEGEKNSEYGTLRRSTSQFVYMADSQRNSLFLDEETGEVGSTPNLHKNKSSSSFHEFIPGHNMPLKDRLRTIQSAHNGRQSDSKGSISLAQRASRMIKAKKYHNRGGGGGKDEGKEDNNTDSVDSREDGDTSTHHQNTNNNIEREKENSSLTSKIFRRFKGGDNKAAIQQDEQESYEKKRQQQEQQQHETQQQNGTEKDNNKASSSSINKTSAQQEEPQQQQMTTAVQQHERPATATTKSNYINKEESKETTTTTTTNTIFNDVWDTESEEPPSIYRRRLFNKKQNTAEVMSFDTSSTGGNNTYQNTSDSAQQPSNKQNKQNNGINTNNSKGIKTYATSAMAIDNLHPVKTRDHSPGYVDEERIIPSKFSDGEPKLDFNLSRSTSLSAMEKKQVEEELAVELRKLRASNSNITDDFFERLKDVSVADHEERMLFVEERRDDAEIDDLLFAKLEQITPPSSSSYNSEEKITEKARFFIGQEQSDEDESLKETRSDKLVSKGKSTLQENGRITKQLDDMFDQIESLNQIMYEELLSLTKQDQSTMGDDTDSSNNLNSKDINNNSLDTDGASKTNSILSDDDAVFMDDLLSPLNLSRPPPNNTQHRLNSKLQTTDLMRTGKFSSTREQWGRRSFTAESLLFEETPQPPRPASSSNQESRRDSLIDQTQTRVIPLLQSHDEALQYVAKYANKSASSLSRELNNTDPSEEDACRTPDDKNINPDSQKQSSTNETSLNSQEDIVITNNETATLETPSETKDVSEVEKTRSDVDKMLLNCQNIDKINNSLTESVPTTPTSLTTPVLMSKSLSTPTLNQMVRAESQRNSHSDYPEQSNDMRDQVSKGSTSSLPKVNIEESGFDKRRSEEENILENANQVEKGSAQYSLIPSNDSTKHRSHETDEKAEETIVREVALSEAEKQNLAVQDEIHGTTDICLSLTESDYGTVPKAPVQQSDYGTTPKAPVQQPPLSSSETQNAKTTSMQPSIESISTTPTTPSTTLEISASPFSFSLLQLARPKSAEQENLNTAEKAEKKQRRSSSYLEKRQSHAGLFSLTKSTSLTQLSKQGVNGGSLNSLLIPPDRATSLGGSPSVSPSGIVSAASTISIPEGEVSTTTPFRLTKVSSVPKLNMLHSKSRQQSLKEFPSLKFLAIDNKNDSEETIINDNNNNNNGNNNNNNNTDVVKNETKQEDLESQTNDAQHIEGNGKEAKKDEIQKEGSESHTEEQEKQMTEPSNHKRPTLTASSRSTITPITSISESSDNDKNEGSLNEDANNDDEKREVEGSPIQCKTERTQTDQLGEEQQEGSSVNGIQQNVQNDSERIPQQEQKSEKTTTTPTTTATKTTRSVLQKQVSIKEYRRRKELERSSTFETSVSDRDEEQHKPIHKKREGLIRTGTGSDADVSSNTESDNNDSNRTKSENNRRTQKMFVAVTRNKRYSHRRRDVTTQESIIDKTVRTDDSFEIEKSVGHKEDSEEMESSSDSSNLSKIKTGGQRVAEKLDLLRQINAQLNITPSIDESQTSSSTREKTLIPDKNNDRKNDSTTSVVARTARTLYAKKSCYSTGESVQDRLEHRRKMLRKGFRSLDELK